MSSTFLNADVLMVKDSSKQQIKKGKTFSKQLEVRLSYFLKTVVSHLEY